MKQNQIAFKNGLKDGIGICLGYIAVSFSLGIAMRNAGMNAFQGFLLSLANLASAGEYADVQVIAEDAAYVEIVLVTLIANARYLLMSTALSQRFSSSTPFRHRFLVGYAITDELFGIAYAQAGFLNPFYYYGAMSISVAGWAFGTAAGIVAGNILPVSVVSALSVSLYGMFLAIIIPPAKKDRVVLICVLASFLLSSISSYIPLINRLSSGMKTIFLTLLIASTAAYFAPVSEEDEHET